MINIAKYLGIPWKHLGRDRNGIDCYGTLMLIYKEELGISLPDYIYPVYKEAQVTFTKEDYPIMEVLDEVKPIYKPFDIMWLQIPWLKTVNHIGVFLGEGLIMEAHDPAGVVCSKYLDRCNCINGVFRLNKNKYREIYGKS